MRSIFFFYLILYSFCPLIGQEVTTLILVRHSEKVVSDDKNPDLTPKGYERAAKLEEFLSEVDLDAIYSTNYRRTINTIDPISKTRDLSPIIYNPSQLQNFASQLMEDHKGQTVLISGHSNTTPLLINILAGKKIYENLNDNEYDWVFILDIDSSGNTKIKKLKLTL